MAGSLLRFLVLLLLGISHLLCSNAVPTTRLERLMHESDVHPGYTHLDLQIPDHEDKNTSLDEHVVTDDGRILVSLNDYPGSGANNRHTPRSQFGRCLDC